MKNIEKRVTKLKKEIESSYTDPAPINEILDKTEKLNKEIFSLKHQTNETKTKDLP